MNDADTARLERVKLLALREFQKTLRENLAYPWEPQHGRPPTRGYVEQKAYAREPWTAGPALAAWSITVDDIVPLVPPPGPPGERKIDGMFPTCSWVSLA